MIIYGGGASLASSPVPLELCAGRPSCREEKEGPVCDNYHETVNYTGHSRLFSLFLVGLRASLLRFLSFAVLVLLRTVLESI